MSHYCTKPDIAPMCTDCDEAGECKCYHDPVVDVAAYWKLQTENQQLRAQVGRLRGVLINIKEVIRILDDATLDCYCHSAFDDCGIDKALQSTEQEKS